MPIRLAIAAPSARPAARATARRGLVAGRGRGQSASVSVSRPAAAAARRIAGALATVSRQPNRPQWHCAPSGSTTMWPISPAPSPSPPNSSPSRIEAGADAAPDLDRDEVRRAGRRHRRGTSRGPPRGCRWRRPSGGRSASCEDARRAAGPSSEVDGPADRAASVDDARRADADAEDRLVRAGEDLVDQVVDELEGRVAVARRRGRGSCRRATSPRRSRSAAVNVRSPRSRVTTWRASSTSATRVGALPPVLGPRPRPWPGPPAPARRRARRPRCGSGR